MVGEFVAHDSRLRFGGLNHGSAHRSQHPLSQDFFGRYQTESGLVMPRWRVQRCDRRFIELLHDCGRRTPLG
jgi:hypothetical protein